MIKNKPVFMSTLELSPFQISEESFWPLLLGLGSLNVLFSFVFFFHFKDGFLPPLFFLFLSFWVLASWAKDYSWESDIQCAHTNEMENSLKWSMGWFISSEVCFFFSFFWGFFSFSLSAEAFSGGEWPPFGVETLNPFSIPLLNTLILVSSGVTLTWSHHSLIEGDWSEACWGLMLTVFLGLYFTCLQVGEYSESIFSFNDSIYGSIFFLATGFHGCHVIIGSLLLVMSSIRLFSQSFFLNHHMGLETSSWYWHFVDVVWLFLFVVIYWWGG